MNPIDSSKKWILNKLIPLIEKQDTKSTSEEDLSKGEGRALIHSHSPTYTQEKDQQYSDLLEDSEYSKG